MIRRNGEYRTEVRSAMRGGDGEVKIEHFWEPGGEMQAPTRMMARLTLMPGASIGGHIHENEEETFIVVQGRAELDDDGVKVILNPGDTSLTGGGAGHSLRNVGEDDLVVIAVINSFCRGA